MTRSASGASIVVADVVEIFAARITQADGVPQGQRFCDQPLGGRTPVRVGGAHLAVAREAEPGRRGLRIACDRVSEQHFRRREIAAIGGQLAEES
jgi:hypothetical protein